MTYTMKYSDWQWLIAPEPSGKRYLLKYRRPTSWTECNAFDTPEAAAEAVSKGNTGQKDWDALKHDSPPSSLASWLIDPSGGVLAPFVPVVSDILRTVIELPTSGG